MHNWKVDILYGIKFHGLTAFNGVLIDANMQEEENAAKVLSFNFSFFIALHIFSFVTLKI